MREYNCDIERGTHMENYDPNIRWGIHTVKITLQRWGYIGHIIQRMGGNCRGKSILGFDFGQFEDDFDLENDCRMKCDEGWFECVLRDEGGELLEIEGAAEDMNELIVGMEIVDFVPESR